MQALEFSTTINNGLIRLPEIYQAWDNATVRVIVLTEKPVTITSQKENLRAIFAKMQKVELFKTIDNPVAWQKQLRDEWE